jgi:hypothetical protein
MRAKIMGPLAIVLALMLVRCGIWTPDMQEIGEAKANVGPDKNALVGEIKSEIERNGSCNLI